jgi:hypothetical protein
VILMMTTDGGERGLGPTRPLVHPFACWRTPDALVSGRWGNAPSQAARVPLQAAGEQSAAAKTQAGGVILSFSDSMSAGLTCYVASEFRGTVPRNSGPSFGAVLLRRPGAKLQESEFSANRLTGVAIPKHSP